MGGGERSKGSAVIEKVESGLRLWRVQKPFRRGSDLQGKTLLVGKERREPVTTVPTTYPPQPSVAAIPKLP